MYMYLFCLGDGVIDMPPFGWDMKMSSREGFNPKVAFILILEAVLIFWYKLLIFVLFRWWSY